MPVRLWLTLALAPLLGFDGETYRPASFAAARSANLDWSRNCSPCFAPDLRYRIDALYTGEVRPITGERAALLAGWTSLAEVPDNAADPYTHELKVLEAGHVFWPVVTSGVRATLRETAGPGTVVTLYVRLVAVQESTWVFLIDGVK